MSDNPFGEPVLAEEGDGLDAILEGAQEELLLEGIDPAQCVLLLTTSAGRKWVPVSEPKPVAEVMRLAELFASGTIEFWVNNHVIAPTELVGPGAEVLIVGVVKSG